MLSFFRQLGRFPTAERWWIRIGGWALVGLAAGFLISFLLPARYTSEATLRLVPAIVSQDLVPHDTVDVGRLLELVKPIVLSRNVIMTIINNLDLYPGERKREPMEDVIEEFRKVVRIDSSGEKLIHVAFTYPEPGLANKVTRDLVSRIIAQMLTERANLSVQSVGFFQYEVDQLSKSWLELSSSVKTTPASDPRYELLLLARDQKRKEYESAAQKLGTAEMLKDLASRGQDVRLEQLDEPILPQEPDTPPSFVGLIGLGCGLAVGLFTTLWQTLRRTPPGFSIPAAEEPA
ncbi:MAG: hypothetical protein LAP61_11105 [Acidobacteriia bacterium]|nr:hypothetical protein [Terriglobia bacterium]